MKEVAITEVDPDDDDDILEIGDDDQLGWMLDQIVSVVTKEELELSRKTYKVAEDITLRRLEAGEKLSKGKLGEITLFAVAFECGLRLPMAPVLRRFFIASCIHPFQLITKS